ncbi:PREDICTED: 40S ribosomal protein S7-like [Amphimedon queenslandica]|uniref:40S ribosomal protein S7 n=1 Tax=Amphimedon queenslandica TaxID=400682 RepID=I1G293_AMPQE|nr:PREDICTED: 40S ribosomal protein S7-like [Amphimedon queenslandica]|eukprot:XP_011402879.1 PREDICTED: 40S ribosomal protein S7-like [Amphimedon queenslandica]
MTAYRPGVKIVKRGGKPLDKFEESIQQAILDIESSSDMKATLREVYFTGAKEVDAAGKKAICIYLPVPLQKTFQKVQVRTVRELEKKFSGRPIVFIAQRRILPKEKRNQRSKQKQPRPRSRTLTAVHNALLDDVVYPAEVVGKRTRIRMDGSQLIKVHLDKTQQTNLEHKLDVFSAIYKRLTGKTVNFEFPSDS